jgi:hypothetical protein
MINLRRRLFLPILLALGMSFAACSKSDRDADKGPLEKAGRDMDKALDQAKEKTGEAMEKAGDAIKNAGGKMRDAGRKSGE